VKLAENKKLAASHSDAEPVRFDFYNALPNMQMPVENLQPPVPAAPPPASVAVVSDTPATSAATPPDATPETPSLPQTEEAPPTTAAAEPTVPESAPVTTAAITTPDTAAVTPVVATAATPVFNAKEITDLLAAEQGLTRYVVQLGVFQTEVAANRLRDAIASVGFPVRVVKSKQGNHRIYSVQQGPYDTAALAKSTQQRLAKRGIISTIQKA
jgi:cell division protein FtsN